MSERTQPEPKPAPDPPDRRLSPAKRRLFRLIAVGVPACVGVVAIVVFLLSTERLVHDVARGRYLLRRQPIYLEEPGHERSGHRFLYDATLGWRNIPNWRATTNGRLLSINSRGLRDREYPYAKPPGLRRMLVLGDSYVWGYGVGDDEIFTEILEARLDARQAGWEVINAGVSGWGTDQQLLFLTSEGLRYEPDLVVLGFYLLNDPTNNSHIEQYGLYKPRYTLPDLQLVNVPVPKPGSPRPWPPPSKDPNGLTAAIIAKMCQTCAAHGCELVVMKFGLFLKPDSPSWLEVDRLIRVGLEARTAELNYLDVDAALAARQIDADSITEGNDDGHWNPIGNAHVAEILEEYLTQRGFLSDGPRSGL